MTEISERLTYLKDRVYFINYNNYNVTYVCYYSNPTLLHTCERS